MRWIRMVLLLGLCWCVSGCITIHAPDIPDFGGGGRKDKKDKKDERKDDSSPSQLPDSPSAGDRDRDTGDGSGSRGGWKDILAGVAGSAILGAEQGALFYAYDTLAYPGKPVDLAVRLQSTSNLSGIEGVTVGFYQDSKLFGSAKTDEDGLAKIRCTPPKVGDYLFSARITAVGLSPGGDDEQRKLLAVSETPLLVAAHDKETPIVVIDLDHTVVESSFFRVLIGGARRMRDSQEVTTRLARTYAIVYLTHRPDVLTVKSKKWLKANGFPHGALLVSRLKQAFGDSGKYKSGRLADLRKSFPNVKIGIGDKLSDAQAYVDNGLTAYLIPHYKQKPEDMRKMAGEIRRVRGRGRLHVVDSWREIEAGIYRGRSFSAKEFASRLERHAKKLQKQRERKEKEDD